MVAELRVGEDWHRPGCDMRCRMDRFIKPGMLGSIGVERHDPEAHEEFGYSLAGKGTVRRFEIATGPLVVDLALRAAWLEGVEIPFSGREWGIVEYLTRHLHRYCSISEILVGAWGEEWIGADNMLRTVMSRTRGKLGDWGHRLIETRDGVGYRLVALDPIAGPIPADQRPSPSRLRWAKAWERCRGCGTTERPHRGRGLCGRCRWQRKAGGIESVGSADRVAPTHGETS